MNRRFRIALIAALASGLFGAAAGALLVSGGSDLSANLLTREAILLVVFAVAAHALAPKEGETLSTRAAVVVLVLGLARLGLLLLTVSGDWGHGMPPPGWTGAPTGWVAVLRQSPMGIVVVGASISQAAALVAGIITVNC